MKRLPLATKVYLVLVPLAGMGLAMSFFDWISLRSNAKELSDARQIQELAVTSLALLLVQDDSSKAMILDPSNQASGRRKIKAYDSNEAVFVKIASLSKSSEMLSV